MFQKKLKNKFPFGIWIIDIWNKVLGYGVTRKPHFGQEENMVFVKNEISLLI